MRKTDLDLLAEDDAPPDDGVLGANGCNKHGCKPCPFWGATDVHSGPVQISEGKPDHAVKCAHCDCVGPWAITVKLAIGLWNDGYESTRPASGRRTRNLSPERGKQSQPTSKPARSGTAD
jgi:hypothetical protein